MISMQNSPHYRWYMLLLAMLTYGSIAGAARLCMPVLFPEISKELGLSMVAIGTIWGMDPLAGVFIGLVGGLLADKFGVKWTSVVVCIMCGVFGALRGFSVDFLTMSLYMFLFGLMAAVMPSIIPKVTAVWFGGNRLGFANGMLIVAWSIGAVFATQFSATLLSGWLGGWRNVMFFYGAPPVLLGLLWWLTGREPQGQEAGRAPSYGEPLGVSLASVSRLKEVWIMGVVLLAYWGTNMGFGGYLPLYLRNVGWEPALADTAMTVFTGIGVFGVMPMVMYSDKTGSRRSLMFAGSIMLSLSIGLIPLVNKTGVWILLILGGLIRTGVTSLANTLIFEIKGVGGRYGGTAIGLTNTLGMLGAFAAPPIGNSLTAFNDHMPLYFWAILGVITLPLLFLVREAKSSDDITAPQGEA